jgi:hypothetical protein
MERHRRRAPTARRAFRAASHYLFDLTNGQMAFQQVTIYDNAERWADADIQLTATNTVRPYAYIGGIISSDTSSVRWGI